MKINKKILKEALQKHKVKDRLQKLGGVERTGCLNEHLDPKDPTRVRMVESLKQWAESTEDYSTTNEITNTSGSAYTAGGLTLTNQSVTGSTSASTAYVDWSTDPQWTSASFTANGAMIYNTTTDGGSGTTDAVCILAFGSDFTATNGTFTVQFPAPGTSTAILRLS